jgi:hypothetical protein
VVQDFTGKSNGFGLVGFGHGRFNELEHESFFHVRVWREAADV